MVAKNTSKKLKPEMFDDLPVLERKWQAAIRPGEKLPRYEDVMLGGLGRLADHIVLLKAARDALEVSRSGRYVQQWLNDERWNIPLGALSPDCATVLGESAANALRHHRPHLALAHCVRDGVVRTYDVLALPTASRWGGTLVGTYVNERNTQYNLLDAVFANTEEGMLSLATLRDAGQKPCDFQVCITTGRLLRCYRCHRKTCNGDVSAQAGICCARAKCRSACSRPSSTATATKSRSTAAIATFASELPRSAT
jgi:hypothetical protein